MSKTIKGPDQRPGDNNRAKQTETPSRQYIDLTSGKICADAFEELPNDATEDPGVRIVTERLSNTSKRPTIIGTQKQA